MELAEQRQISACFCVSSCLCRNVILTTLILFLFALSHFTTITTSIVLIRDAVMKLTYVVKADVFLWTYVVHLFSAHGSSDLVQGKNIRNKRLEIFLSLPVTCSTEAVQ